MWTSDEKRLVIVDDDQALALLVKDALVDKGYQVSVFFDGPPLLRHIHDCGLPHLALIDLWLPSMHGFDLSERLKALGDVPIIFISKQNETDTIVKGITHYADDYITKPFDIRELVARVQRLLSRMANFEYVQSPIITVDDWLSIDFGNSRLIAGDRTIMLTPTEANLLHILTRNAGSVVASDTLLARVWPLEEVFEETLRVHMHRLRRKLEPDYRHPRYIQTMRGVGYQFVIKPEKSYLLAHDPDSLSLQT
jgi:DNA-binding response OmpR family regulator